ncbi:hypothetical protein AB2S62_19915 [Vibrio sp. NTOU-M3]|uniref:hypothetical protein n=1 Tax=Vibrio sp. NTOU-M3 TaxID=3234954 RepID=UPI00349F9694
MYYEIFDKSKLYRCPIGSSNPETCRCSSCFRTREWAESQAALKKAEGANFASGSSIPASSPLPERPTPKPTTKERLEQQRKANHAESERAFKQIEAEKKAEQETFHLAWMQSPVTQSQTDLWQSLFTLDTTEEQKQFVKQCNVHLNEPVREGEIVVVPTKQPETEEERAQLSELIEEAKIASQELEKLNDDEVATLNRHFDVLSYELDKRIREDGLPKDYYAQVATGVGATAALVEQNLKNIQGVVMEINALYTSQVAMASRTGGINYGTFTAERAELFKKLDGSFAMLSKRNVNLPVYTQVKRNLKLSKKSVVHNADEILKTGYVKGLGKRIANLSIGISASKGVGYIGLTVGAVSGVDSIYEACKVDGTGECGKTTAREVTGFLGSWVGGVKGGAIGAAGATALVIGISASAPILAIAAIGGAVFGGAVGGVVGSTTGKAFVDGVYLVYEWVTE